MRRSPFLPWLSLLICLYGTTAAAQGRPVVSLIIDDMGNDRALGEAAVSLGRDVTYAFLPHTPHARRLAERAYAAGSEVLLHLPMEPLAGGGAGPGSLSRWMSRERFLRTLEADLAAVPHAIGLNNHMGSLLTRDRLAMEWLMARVRERQLLFVDSRTTSETVAEATAQEYGIPHTRRNLFLDNDRDPRAIERQFASLLQLAAARGSAVAIGHPYPETIAVLRRLLPGLAARGVELVPVSRLVELQGRNAPWHAPSYPSLRVAKNSKR
ncbi:MAG TPA: divergent polysaccharide deacetylase family protein [Sedimenticola sp.]|nr:divergent polysaccharide deacetylase family protein [Sedimenticola sp.]